MDSATDGVFEVAEVGSHLLLPLLLFRLGWLEVEVGLEERGRCCLSFCLV